jgi:hypothetical protein
VSDPQFELQHHVIFILGVFLGFLPLISADGICGEKQAGCHWAAVYSEEGNGAGVGAGCPCDTKRGLDRCQELLTQPLWWIQHLLVSRSELDPGVAEGFVAPAV